MPGSSNFLQFDPTLTNIESDADYLADTSRAGGAATGALLPAVLFNKFAYQTSSFVAAMAESLKNKGFAVSDASYTALVALLANVKTSADFPPPIQTIAYAGSITFDASLGTEFDLTLTGNVSTSALANTVQGQLLLFIISQDGTGGRTFAWPSAVSNPGVVSSVPSSTSIQMFVVRPSGSIQPVTPMVWLTSVGMVVPPFPVVPAVATTSGTVAFAQEQLERVDATSGAVTRTLFSAIGLPGIVYRIAKTDSSVNQVIAAAASGKTINGLATIAVEYKGDSISMMSDSTGNWTIF